MRCVRGEVSKEDYTLKTLCRQGYGALPAFLHGPMFKGDRML